MTNILPIQLLVGLGNPGSKYDHTRHNAGQDWLLSLAQDCDITMTPEKRFFGLYGQGIICGKKVHLLVPTTYMNLSGQAVQALCAFYKIDREAMLVAHDELDLPAGSARFKQGGGHGGHNGLRDIIAQGGGDKSFHRLRLGIGHPGDTRQVVSYVLRKAPANEFTQTISAMKNATQCLENALLGRWQQAMNCLHSHT